MTLIRQKMKGLVRFAAINLSFMILCVAVILTFSLYVLSNEYLKNTRQSLMPALQMISSHTDNLITRMESIVSELSLMPDLDYDLDKNIRRTISLREKLVNYTASFDFINDILVCQRENPIICAASSTYHLGEYFSKSFISDDVAQQEFEAMIRNEEGGYRGISIREGLATLSGIRREVIYFQLPVSQGKHRADTVVLFKIEKQDFVNFTAGASAPAYYVSAPWFGQTPIYCSGQSDSALFAGMISNAAEGQGDSTAVSGGKTYYYAYLTNPLTGVAYFAVQDYRQLMRSLRVAQAAIVAASAAMMAIGVAIVLKSAYKRKQPLDDLRNYIEEAFPHIPLAQNEPDSLDAARRLLEDLNHNRKKLLTALESNESQLRQAAIYQLITGGYASRNEINESLREEQPYLAFRWGAIAVFKCEEGESPSLNQLTMIAARVFAEETVTGCVLNGSPVLLIAGENRDNLTDEALFYHIIELVETENKRRLRVGVGIPREDVGEIYQSFMEGYTALNYSTADQAVVWGKSEDIGTADYQYHQERLNDVLRGIRQNDAQAFARELNGYIDMLKKQSFRFLYAKFLCCQLADKVTAEILILDGNDEFLTQSAMHMNCLNRCRTLTECAQALEKIGDDVAERLSSVCQTRNIKIERAQKIIDDNVEYADFSLEVLSNQLRISRSNLTQQFKRQYGLTPKEYLDHQRMGRARWYLSETNESIRTIAERLGYATESSFSRKFKNDMGETPGEYRRRKECVFETVE